MSASRRRGAQADLRPIAGQNVLLITIDTLRADALGCYGGPAATPVLDALARDGVRFSFAHAHAVLTLPSHTSILTGEYPYQHGVRENSGYRVAAGTPTLATILHGAGYATAAFVGAFPLHSRFGLNAGFDVYDDRFGETGAPTEFVMPERPAAAVVPLARSWIAARERQNGSTGWFAWVHLFDPHAPYRPPPPFDAEYASRPYYGEVAAVDRALGPLIDDVRRAARPTLIVVTGDHGEALGDHGELTHGVFAYEATLRIPLMVAEVGGSLRRHDGRAAGEVSAVSARHIDILPTILDAVGVAAPTPLPGRTLLPAAERRPDSRARLSYFEAMSAMLNRGWAPLTGVIADRTKYIDLPIPELYDLAEDPGEVSNLAGQDAARERVSSAGLRSLGASLPGRRAVEDPESAARLGALGYVAGEAPLKLRYTEADDPKRLIDIDQAFHRGVDLYNERRYAEAAQIYRDIVARRPDMAIAYRHLAFVEWQSGNIAGAVDALAQAVQRGVRHAGVTAQLGTYLAESGHAGEAIRLLDGIAAVDHPDLDALNALGIAYARAGRSAEARRVFERMLAETPDSGIALENLGTLDLERSDFAAARERFERALAVNPQSSQAHAGLGVVAMKRGDSRSAIEHWRVAVRLDPTNYDALYDLATTLVQEHQLDTARPYLEQFAGTAPRALYDRDIRQIRSLLQRR